MRGSALFLALSVSAHGVTAQEAELSRSFGAGAAAPMILRSTTDLAVMAPVIEAFLTGRPDARIAYEQWGSNDLYAVSQRDCAGSPGADLVISSAMHQMVGLVNEGCARPYRSALTTALEPSRRWRDELWGVTQEPAVMVYNRDLLAPGQVPRSRFDLLDMLRPEDSPLRGRVATYDIEESGLGYLLAFEDSLQATTFGGLMESFGRSGAVATCCSAEIIDAVVQGKFLVAYNVLGSYALARAVVEPRLGVVAPQDYTLVLTRAAMLPTGRDSALAEAFLDFLLSDPGRRALERALLIVPLDNGEGGLFDQPIALPSIQRPIALSPALLLVLDRQKRMLFSALWRDSFPLSPVP